MGCRHYFVVDRLEDLVDEGGSDLLDELTREFSACFTTECGNPDTLKSNRFGCPITTGLTVLS